MWEGCLGGWSILCRQACARNSSPRLEGTAMPSGISLRYIPLAADRRMSIQPGVLLQASLRHLRLGETAMPSGMPLRVLPLAADRRMFCQTEHSLQASLRRMLCLTERMAVFETKFDKGLCRLAQKRYNCLERHVFFCGYARTELEEICQTIF